MLNNFEVIIGIEVHTAINSKTKMFSNAKCDYNAKPNTNVSYMDIALPGILPIVNKGVVDKAIILADALKMKINYRNIQFDRKNYFYPDLPKGFQITQQYFPIGENGIIQIKNEHGENKDIHIERIHMEEDTAKQTVVDNQLLLDFNRAGCPLIEIVTKPCINSAYEAMAYLSELKRILIFKNVSLAKMEEGLLRADVNISIRPLGSSFFGTRVEIKNINSISNVGKAIEYEIKRHIKCLLSNEPIIQETRKYNDALNITESLRSKENTVNYRYMTEPNIINFCYDKNDVDKLLANAGQLPSEIAKQLSSENLDHKQIDFLLDNHDYYCLFTTIRNKINNVKLIFNWISTELAGLLNKTGKCIENLSNEFIAQFINLLDLLDKQEINSKQAKILFEKIFTEPQNVHALIKSLGFEQIKDENIIGDIIDKYIQSNQELVSQYKDRPERVEKFLVGMVMKETNSQANPVVTNQVMLMKLAKYK